MVGLLVQQAHLVAAAPRVLAALLFGGLVAAVGAHLLARRQRWRAFPAVLAGLGLTLILAMTVARPSRPDFLQLGPGGGSTPFCLIERFTLFSDSNAILNLWLFVPFAFFATLATNRAAAVLAASVMLTGAIELVQPITGVGVCQSQDFGNNTLGAALGVSLGWLLGALVRRPQQARC